MASAGTCQFINPDLFEEKFSSDKQETCRGRHQIRSDIRGSYYGGGDNTAAGIRRTAGGDIRSV